VNPTRFPTHEEILARAHDIWEQSGRPEGHAMEHWLRAEQELRKEREQADELEYGTRGNRRYEDDEHFTRPGSQHQVTPAHSRKG
jgi:hypothetical protein